MTITHLPPFDITLKSGSLAVREALRHLLERLGPLELDIEEAGTVELVLAEALNNIVEHAYRAPEAAGPICIRCSHKKDGLHLRIRDRGLSMPDGPLADGGPARTEMISGDLPEGGFGWFLIRDLAKDVQYRRVGIENRLDLRLAVAMNATRGGSVHELRP
ncbi:ATP-binding protein [Sulfitobacter sabulilitoris]|uniref:ATP-binding protein n=1 Tax=Sulfitobacter sabulilitoris TaxID=2562655 RepID=A0A5S3PEJ5_9RHOB|nr:ATP-binding protein [Sulfitobacter sabulilitoris]TMM52379.1 ATP-binding protein [Sulfitobacter sabulilitoris]